VPGAERFLTESELAAWGTEFGAALRWPACVTIAGELGAGKTTLVRAIASALGVTEPVTSPTYALVHQYRAPAGPVYHLDLYRLDHETQLAQLGWDEIMSARAIVLIEWPERAGTMLPSSRIAIELCHVAGRPDVRSVSWPA
jgi:tRNA threonylcarbamoyladenosine biosynthesis protein TsaE